MLLYHVYHHNQMLLYNGHIIMVKLTVSSNLQFTPPFLNHDLTITNANDTDSGSYACAFKLRNRIIDQKIIVLTVVLSEFVCMHSLWPCFYCQFVSFIH